MHKFHRFFVKIKFNFFDKICIDVMHLFENGIHVPSMREREKKEKCFVTGKILLSPLVTRKIRIDAERLASIVIQLSISRDAQFRGGLFYWGD